MGVEQIDQSAGEAAQMHAALGGELKKRRCTRCGVMQAVDGAMGAAGALLIDQGLDMRRILDLLRRDRSCADARR